MDSAVFQLLRLASPALPIGGYSYSQGLESAIEWRLVTNANSAQVWLQDQLLHGPVGHWEAPLLWRMLQALPEDVALLAELNARWLASRESRELLAETEQTGYSLVQLVQATDGQVCPISGRIGLPAAWAWAANQWQIAPDAAVQAYLWSWLENQIMVLMKALPMGQVAGQRLLAALLPPLAEAVAQAQALSDAEFSNFAPGLAWMSMQHETQYSRLFRS